MPSTGWTTQPKQPINKTIGINKLGTLLSSQTTDTPGTTQTQRSRIAPEQLSKLTRIREALQTGVSAIHKSTGGPHPYKARNIPRHFPGRSSGGRSLSFRFSGGDSNYFTHQPDPEQIDPSSRQIPGNPRQNRATNAETTPRRRKWSVCARSPPEPADRTPMGGQPRARPAKSAAGRERGRPRRRRGSPDWRAMPQRKHA